MNVSIHFFAKVRDFENFMNSVSMINFKWSIDLMKAVDIERLMLFHMYSIGFRSGE